MTPKFIYIPSWGGWGYTIPTANLEFELLLDWDATDSSWNGRNWTATDITYSTPSGASTQVAYFNGSTSKIDINYSTHHDPCYVAFHFKSEINTWWYGFNAVMFWQDYWSNSLPLQVRCKQDWSNQLTCTTYDNLASAPKTKEIVASFSDTSSWHTYIAQKNWTSFEFWLDGVSQWTWTLHDVSNTMNYFLGNYPGASWYWKGRLSRVRLYSTNPSASDRGQFDSERTALLP